MTGFVERLKSRKIVQWALAGVAAAFALLQGLDIIVQRFGWPGAIERLLIVAIGIDFFVTLVLACITVNVARNALLAIGGHANSRFLPTARCAVNKPWPASQGMAKYGILSIPDAASAGDAASGGASVSLFDRTRAVQRPPQ